MTNIRDGLKRAQVVVDDLSGTQPVIEAVEIGSGAVLSVNISGGQVIADKHSIIGTGSPPAYGRSILSGEGTLGAGSSVWVVFGNAFAAAPHVVATYIDNTVAAICGSPIGAGSVNILGETASKKFHWIAIGSGAL